MNKRQELEVANILRLHYKASEWKGRLDFNQQKALKAIQQCRTSAMGGHESQCNACGFKRNEYNSCRNRNCPKCQYVKQQQWVDKLQSKLLPCKYFHVVFTVPSELRSIFKHNPEACYKILFSAAKDAIQKSVWLRYRILPGYVGVLHTWTQRLDYHPHLHFIVTAGGITEDHMEWVNIKGKYLAPQKNVSKVFRALLCKGIKKGIRNDTIKLPNTIQNYSKEIEDVLFKKTWKVFIDRPFKGVKRIVQYLGRYIFRIAISNNRICAIEKDRIQFYMRDNKPNSLPQKVELDPKTFIAKFSAHIVPHGFYKVRHYGLFSSAHSKVTYKQALEYIGKSLEISVGKGLSGKELCKVLLTKNIWACPRCKKGELHPLLTLTENTG